MFKRKAKVLTPEEQEEIRTKDFFDMILPGTIKFLSDHYIVGDSYRCVWAIREYPPSTEEQAILSQLADRSGVTLRIQNNVGNHFSPTVIAAAITSRRKKNMPTHVLLDEEGTRLFADSRIMLEQVRTIDRERLKEYVGHADDVTMQSVDRAIDNRSASKICLCLSF